LEHIANLSRNQNHLNKNKLYKALMKDKFHK